MSWDKIDDDFLDNFASITSAIPQRIHANHRELDNEKVLSYSVSYPEGPADRRPEFSTGSRFSTTIPIWLPPLVTTSDQVTWVRLNVRLNLDVSGEIHASLKFNNTVGGHVVFLGTSYSSDLKLISLVINREELEATQEASRDGGGTGSFCELIFSSKHTLIANSECEVLYRGQPHAQHLMSFIMKSGSTWPWSAGTIHGEFRDGGKVVYLGACMSTQVCYIWPLQSANDIAAGLQEGMGKFNGNMYLAGSARLNGYGVTFGPLVPMLANPPIKINSQPNQLVSAFSLSELAENNFKMYRNRRQIIAVAPSTGNVELLAQNIRHYRDRALCTLTSPPYQDETFPYLTILKQTVILKHDTQSIRLIAGICLLKESIDVPRNSMTLKLKMGAFELEEVVTFQNVRNVYSLIGMNFEPGTFGTGGLLSVGDFRYIRLVTCLLPVPSSVSVGSNLEILVQSKQNIGYGAKIFVTALQDVGDT